MRKFSSNQRQEYTDNSYVAPIEVLTKDHAFEIRKKANDDLQRIFILVLQKKKIYNQE